MTKATTCPPGSRADLTRLSDDELLGCFRAEPRDSDLRATICEILVQRHEKLVRACVRQYRGSPEPAEDLMQVGYVGLMKAINNYDPELGHSLSAYAAPCVSGEIKRHFRDKRWQIHVRRSAQEMLLELRKATEELTHNLGTHAHRGGARGTPRRQRRGPARSQAGGHGVQHLLAGRPAVRQGRPGAFGDVLGEEDVEMEHTIDMEAVATHWDELPEREQRILVMRFYGNLKKFGGGHF